MDGCARCCETSERRGLTRSGSLVPGPFQVNGSSGRSMLEWEALPADGLGSNVLRPGQQIILKPESLLQFQTAANLELPPQPGSPSAAASPVALATRTPTASGDLIPITQALRKKEVRIALCWQE